MNVKELIEKYEYLNHDCFRRVDTSEVLKDLKQLDEPQKVIVPQFVADWIEECKNDDFHLFGAMEAISLNQKKIDYWFREDDNMELFARAWLDGYEVEKEKRYWVKLKAVDQYLVSAKDEKFLGFLQSKLRSKFTRKELEDLGFGWVFDCEGIEIEEVEE
nr:MAG TPA: Protein of unknown function (DUF1642) [Caudoviricetes sp.]